MSFNTAQQILDRALDRAALSDSNLVNVPSALSVISTEQRKVFLMAAQLDPEYFGKSAATAVRATGQSWDLDATPGDVGVVTRAYVAAVTGSGGVTGIALGDKVNLVGSRWPELELSPRAYVRGRKIVPHIPIGATYDELATDATHFVTTLTVWYSPLPAVVSATSTTLALPDEWQSLLILPLAKMLALRDKREEEIQFLDAEYKEAVAVFSSAVQSYGHGVRRPLPSVPTIPVKG